MLSCVELVLLLSLRARCFVSFKAIRQKARTVSSDTVSAKIIREEEEKKPPILRPAIKAAKKVLEHPGVALGIAGRLFRTPPPPGCLLRGKEGGATRQNTWNAAHVAGERHLLCGFTLVGGPASLIEIG